MRFLLIPLAAAAAMAVLSGCGHNINVQGFGFACPYGAFGYGTFSCVKDNVKVQSREILAKDGTLTTTNCFIVEDQTTGYEVENNKNKGDSK
jgi:curli biogenesis system outer membrane secretion channel CsgG